MPTFMRSSIIYIKIIIQCIPNVKQPTKNEEIAPERPDICR